MTRTLTRPIRAALAAVAALVMPMLLAACDDAHDAEEHHVATLAEVFDSVTAAWSEGDGEAMAALFEPDGMLVQHAVAPSAGGLDTTWVGREAIRAGVDADSTISVATTGEAIAAEPLVSRTATWKTDDGRAGDWIMVAELGDGGLLRALWVFSSEPPGESV